MKHLLKLLVLNRQASDRRLEIKSMAGETTIYIYDMIVPDEMTAEFFGGIAPQSFIEALNAINDPVIHLRINCPGGDVFAARSIEQAIRQHDSKIIAHIDGYAASAASFIALACDEVAISAGGFFMIHKAWSFAYGNEDDLLQVAGLLGKVDETLVATYASETGQAKNEIRAWMKAESWFNAEESIKLGFADRLSEDKVKVSAWNLSAYDKAPQIESSAPAAKPAAQPIARPVPEPEATVEQHLTETHRARQQQRTHVLTRTAIG